MLATATDQRWADAVAMHLDLFDDVLASDGKTNVKGEAKLAAIEEKIERLTEMRDALAQVTALCDGKGSIYGCPILQALEGE